MPRYARRHAPGALVHVIIRFVNLEFRLTNASTRAGVLERLPAALARADWILHAYALMSSHIHLALTAGERAAAAWLKPLLVSVARYLNRVQKRSGPVVAERATTVIMHPCATAALAAYLHNNPVRAGVVEAASMSDWTSHRAWTGAVVSPAWLDVEAGLSAAGFDSSVAGRKAFDRFVRERCGDPRDPMLSGRGARDARAKVRAAMALPLEVSSPETATSGAGSEFGVMTQGTAWAAPRWDGDLRRVVEVAAHHTNCTLAELMSRSHRRRVVDGRRVVVVAAVWLLRRRVNEAAAVLGISDASASQLHRDGARVLEIARLVEGEVRAGV